MKIIFNFILLIVNMMFYSTPVQASSEIILNMKSAMNSLSVYHYSFLFILVLVFLVIIVLQSYIGNKKKSAMKNLLEVDQLTGVLTRYKFLLEAKKILETARPKEYLLLAVDIDNFKYINKTHGYQSGNIFLQSMAEKLIKYYKNCVLIARDSNDIFILLVKNSIDMANIDSEVNYENSIIEDYYDEFNNKCSISVSRGIYVVNDVTEELDYMLDCANSARLEGKKSFGLTTTLFTEQMRKNQLDKNQIVSDMEDALENNEFYIVIQPKYCLKTDKIMGGEALVRWTNKYHNSLYPDDFIPIFKGNGFISNIDYFVFEKVCDLIKNSPIDFPRLSVNLSAITALQENFLESYSDILLKSKVDPTKIEIEITESAFVSNFSLVYNKIKSLKKLGFIISIDDFGTGQSALNRLKDMDIDILKLDTEFIGSSLPTEKGVSIMKNVINMSKELNMTTVAEGVENKEQYDTLKEIGCDLIQGYYLSKPMNVNEFMDVISKQNDMK